MRRLLMVITITAWMSSSAFAIEVFDRHWKDHYLTENSNADFVKVARKAGCYICHVKGEKKKTSRNEYGSALAKYLDADDFPDDWVDANPEEAKRRIIKAFKKVEEELSKDGQAFGKKIRRHILPAVDSGIGNQ